MYISYNRDDVTTLKPIKTFDTLSTRFVSNLTYLNTQGWTTD